MTTEQLIGLIVGVGVIIAVVAQIWFPDNFA